MELIVFDLDGTLLDRSGKISEYTRETLAALSKLGVAYTVATGRTLHASRELLAPHGFLLPHVYKNGVMIWNPESGDCSHQNFLTLEEIEHILQAMRAQDVTPFVFTLEPGNRHGVYHSPLQNQVDEKLAADLSKYRDVTILPVAKLPADAEITNISALGSPDAVTRIDNLIGSEPHLVAHCGAAWDWNDWYWIDIHHSDANKGGAIETLRQQLGADRVVCFGDNNNDLSMFEHADESYAPENATQRVKEAATAIVGHHDEDGIARFLRKRFHLDQ